LLPAWLIATPFQPWISDFIGGKICAGNDFDREKYAGFDIFPEDQIIAECIETYFGLTARILVNQEPDGAIHEQSPVPGC